MLNKYLSGFVVLVLVIAIAVAACSKGDGQKGENSANANGPAPQVQATPSKAFTAADVAKLKWIEGTWRGMDGEKPFFERYRFEDTTMIVENLDESLTRVEDTSRFELRDGEFGHTDGDKRAAASSITADAVQFVPVSGGGNAFRFEHQADGTWQAVLEWVDKDKKPQRKVYKMEKWPKDK